MATLPQCGDSRHQPVVTTRDDDSISLDGTGYARPLSLGVGPYLQGLTDGQDGLPFDYDAASSDYEEGYAFGMADRDYQPHATRQALPYTLALITGGQER